MTASYTRWMKPSPTRMLPWGCMSFDVPRNSDALVKSGSTKVMFGQRARAAASVKKSSMGWVMSSYFFESNTDVIGSP